jgi:uncharacterized membrane protein
MIQKFNNKEPSDDEWEDGEKPNCFGSYKGKVDCSSCGFREQCSGTNKVILRGKTQKRRYGGKYKGRGKEIERDVF